MKDWNGSYGRTFCHKIVQSLYSEKEALIQYMLFYTLLFPTELLYYRSNMAVLPPQPNRFYVCFKASFKQNSEDWIPPSYTENMTHDSALWAGCYARPGTSAPSVPHLWGTKWSSHSPHSELVHLSMFLTACMTHTDEQWHPQRNESIWILPIKASGGFPEGRRHVTLHHGVGGIVRDVLNFLINETELQHITLKKYCVFQILKDR